MEWTKAVTPALNKHSVFVFAPQDEEGVEATTGWTSIPFSGTLDFNLQGNMEAFEQSDGVQYLHLFYSSGAWFEGGVPIVLSPEGGAFANLVEWITARDDANQAPFCTVWVKDDNLERGIVDVKVVEATINLSKGEPVTFSLTLRGKRPAEGEYPTEVTPDTGGPYLWKDSTVESGWYGGETEEDINFETLEIRIDNGVDDGGEGLRLTEGVYPTRLYNLNDMEVTGSFERDYIVDDDGDGLYGGDLYAAFIEQIENSFDDQGDFAMKLTLTRNDVDLEMDMPRIKFTDVGPALEGSNRGRIVQAVEFQAIASYDDVAEEWVPPVVIDYTNGGGSS